jgi:hypothetical protein
MSEAETTAWVSAVVTAGGTVSGGREAIVDALVVGLKSDGIWTKLDNLWLYAAENTQSALIDVVGLVTTTVVGSPTFTADYGYQTSSTSAYLNTTVADGTNYTDSSAHIADWIQTATTGNSAIVCGNLGSKNTYLWSNASGNYGVFLNDNSGSELASSTAKTNTGFLLGSRTSSTQLDLYLNGSSIASGSRASTTPFANTNFVGCRNNFGTPDAPGTHRSAAFSIGAGLDATEAGNYYTRMNTYMTDILAPPSGQPYDLHEGGVRFTNPHSGGQNFQVW